MLLKASILQFKFEDFESLPSEPNNCVSSDDFTDCHGHGNAWQLILYPVGTDENEEEERKVGLFLRNVGGKNVSAKHTFMIRDTLGNIDHEISC